MPRSSLISSEPRRLMFCVAALTFCKLHSAETPFPVIRQSLETPRKEVPSASPKAHQHNLKEQDWDSVVLINEDRRCCQLMKSWPVFVWSHVTNVFVQGSDDFCFLKSIWTKVNLVFLKTNYHLILSSTSVLQCSYFLTVAFHCQLFRLSFIHW